MADKTTIDPHKLSYSVTLINTSKKKFRINKVITDLNWSEQESEIATKISFKAANEKTAKGCLSSLCKAGSTIIIKASDGHKTEEVARGKALNLRRNKTNTGHTYEVIAYDMLYNLQKSQDYFLFAKGNTAKKRITQILEKWSVPIGKYDGPKCRLGSKKYEARYIADMILDILKKAGRKDGKKYIIRSADGKVEIVKRGSNKTVYVFDEKNSMSLDQTQNAQDIVTKVKIVSKGKDSKTPKTVAVVKGDTKKFGTLQEVLNKEDDESVSEAKKTAKGILKSRGKVKNEGRIQTIDVPFMRKGDKVKLSMGALKGYYYVTSISHDADSRTMTMTVRK